MKKGSVKIVLIFLFIIVLSVSFISASWYSDFWKKLTGKTTDMPSCTDSDAGQEFPNYLKTKGTCVDATGNYLDSSVETNFVKEYYCGPTMNSIDQQSCLYVENNCILANTQYSFDGACTNRTCADSDNGYYPYNFGSVSWYDRSGSPKITDDKCVLDSNILMEAVCDLNGYANNGQTFECPNGCSNGACTNRTCADSDNGYYPYNFGSVSWYDRSGSPKITDDKCVLDSNILMEAVCDLNGYANNGQTFECPNGCSNGNCINITNSNVTMRDVANSNVTQNNVVNVTQDNVANTSTIINETQGEDLEINWQTETSTSEEEKNCNGCFREGNCYDFGYRKLGEYCSEFKEFAAQLEKENSCENNFECKSNICIDGKCVEGRFLFKIIEWLKRVFGD